MQGWTEGKPPPVSTLADVTPGYSHYYSNPSYHTLSQCSPNPPPPSKVSARGRVPCGGWGWPRLWEAPLWHVAVLLCPSRQVPGGQLFASLQAPERPGGAHGRDSHATLPADWKHGREPPGPPDGGRSLEARAPGEGGRVQPSALLPWSVVCRRGSGPVRGGGSRRRGPGV